MTYTGRVVIILAIMLASCSSIDNQADAGVIVTAVWLQAEMDDPDLVLFHVGTEEVYDSIHIPGARLLDPYAFTVNSGDLRNQLPGADSVLSLLSSLGVDESSRIVLYSESERLITRTARVFLTLDHAGYGDRCHVLNGGLDGWNEAETASSHVSSDRRVTGKVTEEVTEKVTEKVTGDKEVTIPVEELELHRWDSEYVLVDVRSAEEYYGEIDSTSLLGSRGHIEGAYFMDYHLLLEDSNPQVFKSDEELMQEFKKAGMDRDKTTVFYCGSGVRASLAYLAARHLDFPVLLYDGSIEEWENLGMPQTSPVIN
jgi:thiosulfate/3-mercaptopyruvate sulfurtransferase